MSISNLYYLNENYLLNTNHTFPKLKIRFSLYLFNADNKLVDSIEKTTLIYKTDIIQAKIYYITVVNCLCAGFIYYQCLGVM